MDYLNGACTNSLPGNVKNDGKMGSGFNGFLWIMSSAICWPMNSGVPTMTVGLGLMERSWAVPKSMILSCSAELSFNTMFSGCEKYREVHSYRQTRKLQSNASFVLYTHPCLPWIRIHSYLSSSKVYTAYWIFKERNTTAYHTRHQTQVDMRTQVAECNVVCHLEIEVDNFLWVSVGHSSQYLLHVVGSLSFVEKVLLGQVVEELPSMQPVRSCVCKNTAPNTHTHTHREYITSCTIQELWKCKLT